ncbi:MAG TPA: multiheme c-type cytochrome [Steroidobacteraceae bacterium]|nr:multiheme c-type cytochrome [Steroidobacteraceae bacterium]
MHANRKNLLGQASRLSALTSLALVLFAPHARADGAFRHLGVASCASSICHGSAKPLDAHTVQQNEYVTWMHFDPHSGAYRTLLEERSQVMARRLGIGAAHEARLCLDCHADNTAPSQRGPRFQLSDGIGCETCHGGAEAWIARHDDSPALPRPELERLGLHRGEDPEARAALCVSCHVGAGERFADHRLMAAGHPRLSFELDTFTELWRTSGGREHYRRDADYLSRKSVPTGSDTWVAGLMEAVRVQLAQMRGAHAQSAGGLPEFALYNCYSCHRAMRFNYGEGRGLAADLAPGSLRLDDSRLVMLSAVFAAVSPADDESLRAQTAGLHRAASDGREALTAASAGLESWLAQARERVSAQPLSREQKKLIVQNLVKAAERGEYGDYAAAEQAAMAIVLLLAETGREQTLKPQIDALFAALADDARYDSARFGKVLEKIKE